MFLPCPENLVVHLNEQKALFKELLMQIPARFTNTLDNGSSLGAALQAAYKLIVSICKLQFFTIFVVKCLYKCKSILSNIVRITYVIYFIPNYFINCF